jgi:hypothetical protein
MTVKVIVTSQYPDARSRPPSSGNRLVTPVSLRVASAWVAVPPIEAVA